MKNKRTERNILIWLLVILSGLLCLRSLSSVFIYPMFLIALMAIALCPFKVCLPILFFLLPFANIIKIRPGQISLFTVLFLVYVLRVVFKKGSLRRLFLISVVFFAGYSFVFSGIGKFITIATLVCGFIALHEACSSDEYDCEEVLYAFCFGIVVSSVLGVFRESLPILSSFIEDVSYKVDQNEYVERFVGLSRNPNYYSMDISMALSSIVALLGSQKIKRSHIFFFLVLSIFGIMTLSKSFLIILVVLVLIIIYNGIKQGGSMFLKILILLAVTCVCVYFFAKESIDTYIIRLTKDTGNDLAGITTGRSDIWFIYFKAILSQVKTLLFGSGLGEYVNEKAPHNTYIEAVYNMGLIGTMIYLFTLRMSVASVNFAQKTSYYVPIVILLIRFMGIGLFVYDSLWYYLILICLLFKQGESKTYHQELR